MKLTFKDLKPGCMFSTGCHLVFIKTRDKEKNAVNLTSGSAEHLFDSVQVSDVFQVTLGARA